MHRTFIALIGLSVLPGCNSMQMAGFAEAMEEDRLQRDEPYAYQTMQSRRELDEIRDGQEEVRREAASMKAEMEKLQRERRNSCRDAGGYMSGSSCQFTRFGR